MPVGLENSIHLTAETKTPIRGSEAWPKVPLPGSGYPGGAGFVHLLFPRLPQTSTRVQGPSLSSSRQGKCVFRLTLSEPGLWTMNFTVLPFSLALPEAQGTATGSSNSPKVWGAPLMTGRPGASISRTCPCCALGRHGPRLHARHWLPASARRGGVRGRLCEP